jgi:hypothetical protein
MMQSNCAATYNKEKQRFCCTGKADLKIHKIPLALPL